MHPIVIIAGSKSPAIGAAVEKLESSGFEVRVLNTGTAKLIDFLSALAGEEDEEIKDVSKEPSAEVPKEPDDVEEPNTNDITQTNTSEKEPKGEEPKKQSVKVNQESIELQLIDSDEAILEYCLVHGKPMIGEWEIKIPSTEQGVVSVDFGDFSKLVPVKFQVSESGSSLLKMKL